MRRLNIFVDETGDFGFSKNSSVLYGISFVFHEQKDNIQNEINKLNERLNIIGYTDMIHTANLITKRDEYKYMNIMERKYIFNTLYHFSRKIPIKYHSIFINKNYYNGKLKLRIEIIKQINLLIEKNYNYFNKFDKIVLYYDNGQDVLGNILDSTFSIFGNYIHIINFDHTKKKLFQVADMLTFIDKYSYKFKNKLNISKNEQYFFELFGLKNITNRLDSQKLTNQKK